MADQNSTSIDFYRKQLEPIKKNWCVAEIKISYHPQKRTDVIINSSEDAYNVLRSMWDSDLINIQEQFAVIFLNIRNEVIGFRSISTGKGNMVDVDDQLIITCCLLTRAQGVIIAHNHPSGNLNPSRGDIRYTDWLKVKLNAFNVRLLDHIILTENSFYSFVDQGLVRHLNNASDFTNGN